MFKFLNYSAIGIIIYFNCLIKKIKEDNKEELKHKLAEKIAPRRKF